MEKAKLKELFKKYAAGTCTEQEKSLLEAWYLQHNEDHPLIDHGKLVRLKRIIFLKLPGNANVFPKIGLRLAAAAVFIGIVISVLFLLMERSQEVSLQPLANDLPPGKNKATLTLANHQQINLTDAVNGQLVAAKGLLITKTANGIAHFDFSGNNNIPNQINTLTTPKGGQWELKLPDGTNVWLNSASALHFPNTFKNQQKRIVTLEGEAYFEVAKDAAHPFIVISGNQQVEVLGTHFNINNYSDEPAIKTTLLEGSVRVRARGDARPSMLKPGLQSINNDHQLEVKSVDTDEVMAWKNGYFQFDDEPITSVMRKLSRWYDVQVNYEDGISTEGINGRVSRNKNISQVIKALEATKTVHFKLEGRRITVMK
jgi:ferric-dicitrate binding protein FerR (iron transport regulator)